MSALFIDDGCMPPPDYRPGDIVRVKSRYLGVFDGTIAKVWPRGITAWRNGVKRTKPHFLKFGQVERLGCVDIGGSE